MDRAKVSVQGTLSSSTTLINFTTTMHLLCFNLQALGSKGNKFERKPFGEFWRLEWNNRMFSATCEKTLRIKAVGLSQKYSRLRQPLLKFSSLYKAEALHEGRLKVMLHLQVSREGTESLPFKFLSCFKIVKLKPFLDF